VWNRRAPAAALGLLCGLLLLIGVPLGARADVLIAGAATRGFFDWEAMAGYERGLPIVTKVKGLTFPLRFEGHFATREGVTNMTFSSYLLATYRIPGFEKVDFSPYLATGPALHLQGAWTNLGDFGDVLVEGETTVKWQALVGTRLIAGERADLYTEARYTIPSDYDFDYIAFGIRFHGRAPAAPSTPEPPAPESPTPESPTSP
jgi:hypothetical protein